MSIQSNNNANQGAQVIAVPQSNIYYPPYQVLAAAATPTVIGNKAYFSFLGTTLTPIAPLKLYFPGNSAGAASAALGFFSSPSPPNQSTQVMTRLVATTSITFDISVNFVVSNTTPFATLIPAGTNLWSCYIQLTSGNLDLITTNGDLGMGGFLIATSSTSGVATGSPITATVVTGFALTCLTSFFTF